MSSPENSNFRPSISQEGEMQDKSIYRVNLFTILKSIKPHYKI